MAAESLLETVERLFDLLEAREVDYLLVGGIALLQYVEGRNTADVDLIMAIESLALLPELQLVSQDEEFAHCRFGNLQVDLLLMGHPLFASVAERYAARRSFAEREIPCATVEGLLLLKLFALPPLYRQGNFARVGLYENDVATLLEGYRPAMEPLLAQLAVYLSPADFAEVRDIVAEIEGRIARFRRG